MTRRRSLSTLVVAALIAAACTGGSADRGSGHPAINAGKAALLPATTDALPTMNLATFKQLLAQLRGTPVVVNIWASWCGPCRTEAPLLVAATQRHGKQIQFIGIDILDSSQAARGFIQRYGIPYPSVFDPSGGIRTGLGFIGQPNTLFFDAAGKMVSAVSGPMRQGQLRDGIRRIIPD